MTALAHHWNIFKRALADERLRERAHSPALEAAFLPAALEVLERPVSPTARMTGWVLLAGLTLAGGCLILGRVDVVASTEGKIVPTESVKLVQSADGGTVRRIHVREGDHVRRGQPLIDLDPTVSTADEAQARQALLATELDIARGQALVDGLSGQAGHFKPPEGTPADVAETQRRLVEARLAEARAGGSSLAAQREAALREAAAAAQQIRTFNATGPLLDKQVNAVGILTAKGYASNIRLLELQRQQRAEQGNRDVAVAQQARSVAEAKRFAEQGAQSIQQARQNALTELARAQSDAMLRREELKKAVLRSGLRRIFAPNDGTVQQISVHTVGGVVEPARPLMVVVPDGTLAAEFRVLNRDIGFIHPGQAVAIKLEAFPFTRYGSLRGRIATVSRDAVQDEKGPPYYVARVVLQDRTIDADGRRTPLTPGLNATGDIRIGSRRIISYLLDPMQSGLSEAGRER